MSRNFITQAIVLKTNRIGEIHKGIVLLTKDLGIISAIAHGARKIKSRLRAYTQLFSYVKVYLYYNPVKQTYKITDIESVFLYDAVVQSLKKYYIISVCAEVTLKSFGGGESVKEMFFLILNILKILNRVNENDADFILIQFLWRFLLITGHRPDLKNCSHCNTQISGSVIIYYSDGMPGFVCGKCKNLNAVQLYPGIIKYLENTEQLQLVQAVCYKVEKISARSLKKALIGIVETCIETPLQSIRSGKEYI